MLNEKYVLNIYTLQNWARAERHLERMASNGWRLERTGNLFWKYRRMEPARIHYAVTCLPRLWEDTPRPDTGEELMNDFCEAGGWKRTADWKDMLIYENSSENPVPVETDEELRLNVIYEKVSRRQLGEFAVLLIPLLYWLQLHSVPAAFRGYLFADRTAGETYALLLCGIVFFLLPFGNWIGLRIWKLYAKYRIGKGDVCPPDYFSGLNLFLCCALMAASVALYLSSMASLPEIFRFSGHVVMYTGGILLVQSVVSRVQIALRERGKEKWENRGVSLAVSVVLCIVLVLILDWIF